MSDKSKYWHQFELWGCIFTISWLEKVNEKKQGRIRVQLNLLLREILIMEYSRQKYGLFMKNFINWLLFLFGCFCSIGD